MSLLKDKIEVDIQEAELGAQKALNELPWIIRWLVVLIILAIIPSYYISKNVSQKIWLSRYQQGALTAKPSFTNPLPPKTSDVSVTSLGPGQYAAIVQITNQNLDLSLDQVPYSFIFYNSSKQEVYTYSDNLYLLPNQTKYLTVPTFSSPDKIAYTNFQIAKDLPWQKRLSIPTVDLTTSLPSSNEQFLPLALVVQGDFVNNSPYTLKKVRLTFVLFDQSGKIIGTSQRDESTVAPFERRTYKQLWPNLVAPNLGRVQVTADTDTLDNSNLTTNFVPSGSGAGDLSRPKDSQNGF